MRRTVIFVTLISLLIAVAGVTAAQNGVVDLDRETTTPEPRGHRRNTGADDQGDS